MKQNKKKKETLYRENPFKIMYIAVGNLFHIKSWSHDVGKEKGKITAFMEE